MKIDRPIFTLQLRPEPHVADEIRTLNRALKTLLRQFGLRCVAVEESSLGRRDHEAAL
jgi:hypothetical protein